MSHPTMPHTPPMLPKSMEPAGLSGVKPPALSSPGVLPNPPRLCFALLDHSEEQAQVIEERFL